MREILFRAKRTDNKGLVEGLLTIMWGQYHIIKPSDENTAYPIDPETVCQYTGLTDKNGRKIFEGDCLGHKENIVEYLCGRFTVSGDRPLSMMAKYNEVVGNVFDKE